MESVEVTGSPYDQNGFAVRFDWGVDGLRAVAGGAHVVVVVDVLSFTTCVDIATSRGAVVLPLASDGELDALSYADSHGAVLARRRSAGSGSDGWSLSPTSLISISSDTRLVLPSPNGSAIAAEASILASVVLAGCLRNASSVAAAANQAGPSIAVIAAGERWGAAGGRLRPPVEDFLGAGAIISRLAAATRSPEAAAAAAAFDAAQHDLVARMRDSASGRELIAAGFSDDVELAAALDSSDTAPTLREDAFVDGTQTSL